MGAGEIFSRFFILFKIILLETFFLETPNTHEFPRIFTVFFLVNFFLGHSLQNLCCGSRLVHICNYGVHGFLLLNVFVKKHMKTQLVLTILNFHLFSHLWFPKIFKMEMSHVCGRKAGRHLFCFTSAAVLISFSEPPWYVMYQKKTLFCMYLYHS